MTITALPAAPQPSDSQEAFNTRAFSLVASLDQFVTEANALASQANTDSGTATTQAGIASASADLAVASANEAEASAASAAVSAASAAASYDYFHDRYLGSKTADPAVDNDGNALVGGALYWNSATGHLRVWDGSLWGNAAVSGAVSEADLASSDPAKGAAMVGYRSETVNSALDRHELIDQDNGIALFQGINAGNARLFIAGVDSLTDGAGGSDWHRYFKKIMRGQLGDGGPGLHFFDNGIASEEGVSFGLSGLSVIAEDDGIFYPYSLAGRGLYTLSGDGSPYINWSPASNWTTARVFYLKQSSGGTFAIGTADMSPGALTTINTSNSGNALGYVDVPIGAGVAGHTLAIRAITGRVCLFAALFTRSTSGFLWGNIAKGGRKLSDVAAQDSTMRREWLAALTPSHFLLNGGANDKSIRTGAQHNVDLSAVITDIQTASPNTAITIIQHNHISGEETTYLPDHAIQKIVVAKSKGVGYIDVRKLLGSYVDASSNGLMYDGTHPSDKANKAIASLYANRLGFGGNSADYGATPYRGSGVASIVKFGALTTKSFTAAVGVATTAYTLGLNGGYPSCSVKLRISCNRNGSLFNTVKDVLFSIGNGATTNTANNVTTPTVIQLVKELAGDSLGVDFSVTATITSGKCVVVLTPSAFTGNFVVEGSYAMTYNTTAGQAVFEN